MRNNETTTADSGPAYKAVVRICGLIAIANPKEGIWLCKGCGNTTNFSAIEIPYAYKLLLQELETMSISSRILTQKKLLKQVADTMAK